ncbi:hypothetical protein MVEN_00323600 [Mycena venus]|uniref:CxC2-like cysteine cluster KDZ transposase-associated domain-containing protein n=1 Tax=Mycena venus TaxID=2733690 RepID=A0A8H6YTJ1_9AGAR|nr:hypothetical protein MVEN_00323600 [Mycena venus]
MAKPRVTVTTTVVSDSESEDGELPRMEQMRYDSTVRVGNRTKHTTSYVTVDASPGKRKCDHQREPDTDFLFPDVAPDPGPYDDVDLSTREFVPTEEGFAFDEGHPVDTGPRESRASDRPLTMWEEDDLEEFLDEQLRGEGRGDYIRSVRCAECWERDVQAHRCEECFTDALFCGPCIVRLHADNPFHVVQTWDGTCFTEATLRELGFARSARPQMRGRLSRSHRTNTRGERWRLPASNCCARDCSQQQHFDPHRRRPFRVLRKFHKQSFESKCSAYEFYNALAREMNNTGNFQPRNRYREFLLMTWEWRHLQMLKRSGRAHIPGGAQNIEPGACALLCPACPQPGKNLPVNRDWKSAAPNKRFLYAQFVAIYANFRMKRKQVSSEEADPGLNRGAAFFGEVKAYMDHVGTHWDMEQEKSRCVSHDAVNQPDREARGTASSGIGIYRGGERYINMDYMLWLSLAGYDDLVTLIVSYDIVCQWQINIWQRLSKYKPQLCQRAGTGYCYYVWLIPKFHLPAHIEACNILYSFNLTPYVGQTDGEAPERGWANANPLAASTKEMGPGARRDVLDDHFNDWNHKKIIALGRVMLERIQKAVAQMNEKQEELVEMEASLPTGIVKEWTAAMELWEADASKPNLFNEVENAVAGDKADDMRGDLHAYEMLAMGMQLEQSQRELASDIAALKSHASDGQKTTVLERGNKLRRKIASWIQTQTDFQPSVKRLREADDLARVEAAKMQPTAGVPVEALKLWLPSKQARTPGAELKTTHARYEFDMREATAHEALEEIRCLLLVRTHNYKWKDKNVGGIAGHTRSRTMIEVLDERIRREAGELGETQWALVLKPLDAKDIHGMPRGLFSDPERKKRRKKRVRQDREEPGEMSWIWRTGMTSLAASASSSEEAAIKATNECLRVEWAKARARAHRWTEEALEDDEMTEGFTAYSERQARIQAAMKERFAKDWKDVATWIALGRQGVVEFKERAAPAGDAGGER